MFRRTLALCAIGGCNFGGPSSETPPSDGGPGVDTVDAVISLPISSPRKLVFQNMGSDKDLVNFPVLVPLDPTKLDYGKVTDPKTQLRFHDPDTDTDIPFDVEKWDPAAESLVWVRVPTITKNKNTDFILMFFGADANGTENKPGVWGDYELVTHLGTGAVDVSNHAHDGIPLGTTNPTVAAAEVGDGCAFAGTGDSRLAFASGSTLFDGWTDFTLELWVRADYATINDVVDNAGVIDRGGPLAGGRVFRSAGVTNFQIDFHFNDQGNLNDGFLPTPITLGAWTYIAYTYDGAKLRLFANGVKKKEEDHPRQLNNDSRSLFLGDQAVPFKGMLDEIRVTRSRADDVWINAQYLAMTRTFIQFQDP